MLVPQIVDERVQQRTLEQTVDVSIPKVVEEIVQVVQITDQERFSERSVKDCRCASVSELKEIVMW